jgi:hypothetical protein
MVRQARLLDRLWPTLTLLQFRGSVKLLGIGWRIQEKQFQHVHYQARAETAGALTQFHKISKALMAGSIYATFDDSSLSVRVARSVMGAPQPGTFTSGLKSNLNNPQLVEKKHTSNASFSGSEL